MLSQTTQNTNWLLCQHNSQGMGCHMLSDTIVLSQAWFMLLCSHLKMSWIFHLPAVGLAGMRYCLLLHFFFLALCLL